MDASTLADLQLITGIGQNITVAGVLFVALVMFIRGDIISRPMIEKIITGIMSQVRQDMDERFDELGKKIDKISNRGW